MTVEELIERLGKATGPTFVLDEAIHAWRLADMPEADRPFPPKSYTSSIDAALTLVPAHHCWEVRSAYGDEATVWTIGTDYDDRRRVPTGHSTVHPALALCIAALRARSSVKG